MKENKFLESLQQFLYGSLTRKLIVGLLITSIIPLSLFGFIVYRSYKAAYLSDVQNVTFIEALHVFGGQALFFAFVLISSLVMLSIFYSFLLRNSTDKLYEAAKQIEKGNFKTRIKMSTKDEFEKLANAFNRSIESLERSERERQQLDNAKTEFLSISSHELRSPLNPMRVQLQMLLEGYFGKMSKKQKSSIEMIFRNTKRLDNILKDFVEISHIEAGRLKIRVSKTDISKIIRDLVNEMKYYLPEKKVKLKPNIGKLPIVEADSGKFIQVLRNLVNNAIKFSKEKGKVIVSAKVDKNKILFEIKDNGIGISEMNLEKIFKPFYQEEQTIYRKYQGAGLGLTITRGLVEAQGGKIWVKSTKGKGTSFFFTLPLKPLKSIIPVNLIVRKNAGVNNFKNLGNRD